MPKLEIPAPLREITAGQVHVEVAGTTVREALADLVRQYPAIEAKLFDGAKLRPYINVFVNDEDIRFLDEMDTKIEGCNVIALIPAVAGG